MIEIIVKRKMFIYCIFQCKYTHVCGCRILFTIALTLLSLSSCDDDLVKKKYFNNCVSDIFGLPGMLKCNVSTGLQF